MSMAVDYGGDEILFDDAPSEPLPSMPIPSAPPPGVPVKPSSSTRLLVLLLQATVMALALLLFFLFAGIAALVLVHLFVAGRALRRRRSSSGLGTAFHGSGDGDASRAGLSKEDLRRLPSTRYASRGRLAASLRWPDCAVCLEGLREGDRCRVLPGCGHGFHKACVDKWLVKTPACPLCRAAVGGGRR